MLEDIDIKFDMPENEEKKNPFEGIAQGLLQNVNIKGYARWVIYAVKAEITLSEFRFLIYWQSLVEFGLMLISFVLLLMSGRYWILLHVLHFVRPYLGLKLLSSLPKSHEIFEELPSLTDTSTMHPVIFTHFKRANSQMTKYLVVSGICFLLDIIGCIVSFIVLNDSHNSDLFYGFTAWVFLCFDSLLVFWYNTLRWMYPDDIWQNIRSLLKSGLSTAQLFLSNFVSSAQDKFRRNPN